MLNTEKRALLYFCFKNANRGTAVRQITSPTILSPSEKVFVSGSSYIVVKLDLVEDNTVTEVVCGQANKPGNEDGVASSAMLQSPRGIAAMGTSLFICDTGNRSIRLVSSAVPLKRQCPLMRKHASQGLLFSISTLSTLIGEPARQRQEDHPAYSVYFALDDVVAIKHAEACAKERSLQFFLAVLLKDVLTRETPGNEFEFVKDTVDVLWLNNSDSDDPLAFTEAYRDYKNSPYTIVDKIAVVIEQDASRVRSCTACHRKRPIISSVDCKAGLIVI